MVMLIRRLKVFLLVVASFFLLACPTAAVFADDACSIAGFNDPLICGTPHEDEEAELKTRVRNVLNVVYLWIGIIAVIVMVIGGIRYMTSQGEPDRIKGAKNTIMYALIGLIVTLAAFAITNFVLGALNGKTSDGGGGGGGSTVVDDDHYKVKSIKTIGDKTLEIGQNVNLKASVVPDYAKNRTLTYSSSDEKVATVDSNGNVMAKGEGSATITVTSPDGPTKTVAIKVVKPIEIEKITLSPTKITLEKGKKATIKATIEPKDAVDKTITWSSNNKKVATVDKNGKVTAKKTGEATITAKTKNGKTATVKVTVGGVADWVEKLQYHQRGKDLQDFGVNDGCGVLAMTTAIKILNNDQKLTPKEYASTVRAKVKNSTMADGVSLKWEAIRRDSPKLYGLTSDKLFEGKYGSAELASIKNHLVKGHMIVSHTRGGIFKHTNSGNSRRHKSHTIMFYKYANNKYWAKDSSRGSEASIGYMENVLQKLYGNAELNSVWWVGRK